MNHTFLANLDDYIKSRRYRLVNAVLVYENDQPIFQRYYNKFDNNSTNETCSVWKSLLSITLGICLDKGLIKSVDEPISRYLPAFAQNISPMHRLITIRHLLTMSSGIYFTGGVFYHCPMQEQMVRSGDWVSYIADIQMRANPGTFFQYKEWDVVLLSAIIGKACGGHAWDIAQEFLYNPLGIMGDKWPLSRCGTLNYNVDYDTANDAKLTAIDMAKIGRMMLNDGVYEGQRIVSEAYVKESIAPSKASGGYGYLWWLTDNGYHARGFSGQEINIFPDKNAVVVVQATVSPMGKSYPDICAGIIQ